MAHQRSAAEIAHRIMSVLTLDRSPLFDLAPNCVLAIDTDGTIVYANAAAVRMFGYREAQLIGRPLETLVPARFAEAHSEYRRRYNAKPRSRAMGTSGARLIGSRRDGTEFPIDVAFGTVTEAGVAVTFAVVMDLSLRQSVESRLEGVSRAYGTLEAMTRHMGGVSGLEGVLAVACNLAVDEGHYLGAWAGRATDDGRIVVVAASDSVEEYVSGLDISIDARTPGPVATALARGVSTFIDDFDERIVDTPWIATARSFGIRASATLPVRCEAEVVAALTFFSDQPDVFTADVRTVLEGIVATVRTYLERSRSESRLRTLELHRRELLQRLVTAEEQERAKIAADVHDDTIGTVVAVQLRLSMLEKKIAVAAPELTAEIEILRNALDTATHRLRSLLFALDTPEVGSDLIETITSTASFLFEGTTVRWTVTGELTQPVADTSFVQGIRIAKEALANARTHSGAGHVNVMIRNRDAGLEISIRDDGIGIDPANIPARLGHRGLSTMRDRAEMLGGSVTIQSDEKSGTTVRAWLPMDGATAPNP